MSRRTPLVGVTTYYAEVAWGTWCRPGAVVPAPYFELVAAAGARPVLLPPCRTAPGGPGAGAGEVVAALDGLVLIGGGDVDPGAYGHPGHPAVAGADGDRDRSERDLLSAALDRDLPVLAICRGLQVLNVHLGGTLHPHLPDRLGHDGHQPAPGIFADVEVVTVPGTRTAAMVGPRATVRCSHHQAVDRLGEGLVVAARAAGGPGGRDAGGRDAGGRDAGGRESREGDAGVVEAAELPDRAFVVGLQWHPEEAGDRRPFDALVAAAR